MAKGISLHVGVNRVNAGINVPTLRGCENDAKAMHDIAVANGFSAKEPILSEAATFDRVVAEIVEASTKLEDGDIFLCTFSGHGTRETQKLTATNFEEDFKDETIVLHDRILIDDVFKKLLWPKFKQGVRILGISDSCHSESVFFIPADTEDGSQPVAPLISVPSGGPGPSHLGGAPNVVTASVVFDRDRAISEHDRDLHFELFKDFYDNLRATLPSEEPPINASLLLLGACRKDESAKDGDPHGVFTQALIDVLKEGTPENYNVFLTAIQQKLLGVVPQHPVLTSFPAPNQAFLDQRPFSIN